MRNPPHPMRLMTLGELILSRRHDQLKHLANTLVGRLGTRLTCPARLAPLLGLRDELSPRFGAHLHRAQQVEAPVDQLLWAQRALGLQSVDDGAESYVRRISDHSVLETEAGY